MPDSQSHDAAAHERASRIHEEAAFVHERAAGLQSRHAEEMREIGDFARGERADGLAEQEWELAAAEARRAADERDHAAAAFS